ncbi:MAG TPA: sensor histidine kinase [Actinophytocola sp.]|uniref:sensor histidine kinase n=1 Tax=Actinophytocola sp. TaxID=1872138 RepID=UPI002DDCB572|nr:sensor histidine kinase [Actinophytocola sp.]HEV2781661.1 sensor histidine kinase [Actinophytocola sp.]
MERARQWLRDGWPSLPVLAIVLLGTQGAAASQSDAVRPDVLGYALAIAAVLGVVLHRRPGLGLAVNGLTVSGYLVAGYPYGPVLLTVPVVVFTLARRWPFGRATLAVAADFAVIIVAVATRHLLRPTGLSVTNMLWLTVAWGAVLAAAVAAGTAVRVRQEATAGVRAEQARRAASEERLRMAQDLHDSVGHGLAVIAMQAGIALRLLDRDPEAARTSMEAVRATSRESLESLRAQLEALCSPGAAQRRPAPGLDDLERLTDRVRAGGVALRVHVDPDLPALPSEVDTAAYRILQESLTNVLRHAGATSATIRVGCAHGALLLEVTDTGRTGAVDGVLADTSGGSGISGMRAQAEALGGSLRAGPDPAGGFAVAARLPLHSGGVP